MWWRLGNDGYDRPAELLGDLRMIGDSLRAHAGARVADGRVARLERMVELFGFHLAKLDVRVHARELDSERATNAVAAAARRASVHGPEALDTLIVSGTSTRRACAAGSRPGERRARGSSAVRDGRRPRRRVHDRRRAARRPALRARRSRRGDGRLLRLGQGRAAISPRNGRSIARRRSWRRPPALTALR